MTAADTNVRPAWRGPATTARGAGASALARLLLYFRKHRSKLDRKPLLLLLAASLTPACIIPVGPEFQDPLGVANSPPYVFSAMPIGGTLTTASAPTFIVTPSDPNVGDDLYFRWITEFPPQSVNTRIVNGDDNVLGHSADGTELRKALTFSPTCYSVQPTLSTHFITFAVSDRKWAEGAITATADDTSPAFVTWIWEKNCQP